MLPSAAPPQFLNRTVGNNLPAPVDVKTICYDGLLSTNITNIEPI